VKPRRHRKRDSTAEVAVTLCASISSVASSGMVMSGLA